VAAQLTAPACVTTSVPLALTRVAGACAGDDECGADATCVLDLAAGTSACGTPSLDARANGGGCSADAQCAHGACVDALCSGLCASDSDCSRAQRCARDDALGTNVCALDGSLAVIACDNDDDCAGTGRACDSIVNGSFACGLPSPGAEPLDTTCESEGPSNTCASGLCDDASVGVCTLACASDSDCAAPLSTCTSVAVEGVTARACFEPCDNARACDDGRACRARSDAIADAIVFACDGPRGDGQLDDDVDNASECASNFALDDQDGVTSYCSAPCRDSDDQSCQTAGDVMKCSPAALTRPSGGAQQIDACVRTGA
jgi:hypothetical protein